MSWWDAIADFFEGVWRAIRPYADAAARDVARNGGKLLMAAAMEAVLEAEKTEGDWRAKRDAAFSYTEKRLKEARVPIVISAVNKAIEMAHAKAQGS